MTEQEARERGRLLLKLRPWTLADGEAARLEGWDVFEVDGRQLLIQRLDDMGGVYPHGDGEPLFVCDDDAVAFVKAQACAGSALHAKAWARHKTRVWE